MEEVANANYLLEQVKDLQLRALNILSKAEEAEDWRGATSAIREARGCLELLGRLAGELREGQTFNNLITTEWNELRATILEALDYHPYPQRKLQSGTEN